jgi:hypothetical protein
MFEVVVDPDVIDRLAPRLDLLSIGLSHPEWAHLVALLGLGSTALADAVGTAPDPPRPLSHQRIVAMGSPSFAGALNPAAEAIEVLVEGDHCVAIVQVSKLSWWEVHHRASSVAAGADEPTRPAGAAASPRSPTDNP